MSISPRPQEKQLWSWLKKARLPRLDMQRIENMVMKGTPDVEMCWAGVCCWIEMKATHRPTLPSTPLKLQVRPEQIDWMLRRQMAGGMCGFLVLVGPSAVWGKGQGVEKLPRRVYLIGGEHGAALKAGRTVGEIEKLDLLRNVKPSPRQVVEACFRELRP